MKHFLLNITWRCQNDCSYCWMQRTVGKRPAMQSAPERPLADWVAAIQRDKPELVDIAGGEPLLIGWLPDLFRACPQTAFGLSTNGLSTGGVEALCRERIGNVVAVNVSYHPESPWKLYDERYKTAVGRLRSVGYPVHTNLVLANDNKARSEQMLRYLEAIGVHVSLSPYEEVEELGMQTSLGLCCKGGVNHLNVAPDGSAWPCLTTMRSPYYEQTCLGNWLDGTLDLSRKEQPCYLYCADYYILPKQHQSGDMWRVEARPCAS